MKNLLVSDMTHFEERLPAIKQAGTGIEIQSFFLSIALDKSQAMLELHKAALSDFSGEKCLHGPFVGLMPGCMDAQIKQVTAKRMAQALFIAQEIGCSRMVAHFGMNCKAQRRWDYVDRSAEFWTEFARICPDGFSVHVENVYDDRPDDILSLSRKLENPKIGITLDIGHANIFSKIPVWEWIEAYGNRLTHVHLHDNNGEEDEHLPLGQGSIDLDRVIVVLEKHAPMAVWSIEAEPTVSLAWLKSRGIWAG